MTKGTVIVHISDCLQSVNELDLRIKNEQNVSFEDWPDTPEGEMWFDIMNELDTLTYDIHCSLERLKKIKGIY